MVQAKWMNYLHAYCHTSYQYARAAHFYVRYIDIIILCIHIHSMINVLFLCKTTLAWSEYMCYSCNGQCGDRTQVMHSRIQRTNHWTIKVNDRVAHAWFVTECWILGTIYRILQGETEINIANKTAAWLWFVVVMFLILSESMLFNHPHISVLIH